MNSPTYHATGWINVVHYEPKPYDQTEDATLSEAHVTQDFTGALTGTGTARFLMVATADGTTHFTGIERFTGTLDGRTGSFLLRNTGILRDGQVTSEWLILPGSATGELAGLTGTGGTGVSGYFLNFSFD